MCIQKTCKKGNLGICASWGANWITTLRLYTDTCTQQYDPCVNFVFHEKIKSNWAAHACIFYNGSNNAHPPPLPNQEYAEMQQNNLSEHLVRYPIYLGSDSYVFRFKSNQTHSIVLE